MKIYRFVIACFIVFLTMSHSVMARDTFDVNTGKLMLGAVTFNNLNYGDVVAEVTSYTVIGIDGGFTNGIGSFDSIKGLLKLGSVTASGLTYVNLRVIVTSYRVLSFGASCPVPAVSDYFGICVNPSNVNDVWDSDLKIWVSDSNKPFNAICPTGESVLVVSVEDLRTRCGPVLGTVGIKNGISPDKLFTDGFIVTTNGATQVPNVANVTLRLNDGNGALVPVTLSNFAPKSFKVMIPTKQNYSQTLFFKAVLNDSIGRAFTVTATFTTAGICPSSSTVSATGDACIYQKGVIFSVPNNLPATMTMVTDAAFRAATMTGQAYLVETDIKAYNSADIVMAVYRLNNKTIVKPLFRDTLTDVQSHNNALALGMANSVFDMFMGASNGLIMRGQPGNKCWIAAWFGNTPGYAPGFYFDDYTACPSWN